MGRRFLRCDYCGGTYRDDRECCPHCLAPRPDVGVDIGADEVPGALEVVRKTLMKSGVRDHGPSVPYFRCQGCQDCIAVLLYLPMLSWHMDQAVKKRAADVLERFNEQVESLHMGVDVSTWDDYEGNITVLKYELRPSQEEAFYADNELVIRF